MRSIRSSALAALLCTPLAAQFSSLTTSSVAPGCNLGFTGCCAIVEQPATLQLGLDTTQQRLDVAVQALEGCCGVSVVLRALVLGGAPVTVPLPQFGAACTLHVQPDVLLATTGTSFALPLPPNVATLGFLAQGLAWQTWSFAPGGDRFLFTDAIAVTLQ
jgi:hypothetical protein